MLKKIALAATVTAATVLNFNPANASEPSKAELWATLSASFEIFNAKCPGKMGAAFLVIVSMHDNDSTAKQKAKARTEQNAAISSVGISAYCNLLDGQMALMDKKVSEAK